MATSGKTLEEGEATEPGYLSGLVRRFDHDRYLCALFMPDDVRDDVLALLAFNIEVTQAQEASEPILGKMRVQWWRDNLDAIVGGQPPAHPIAKALSGAVIRHALSGDPFERYLNARFDDLDGAPMADMAALTEFVDATAGTLIELSLAALGTRDNGSLEVGRDVARSVGLTGILRAVPYHASQRRRYLPNDLCAVHGLDEETLFAGSGGAALASVMGDIAKEARASLARARVKRYDVPRTAVPALLGGVLAECYLTRMQKDGYAAQCGNTVARSNGPGSMDMVRLAWRAWRKRY